MHITGCTFKESAQKLFDIRVDYIDVKQLVISINDEIPDDLQMLDLLDKFEDAYKNFEDKLHDLKDMSKKL